MLDSFLPFVAKYFQNHYTAGWESVGQTFAYTVTGPGLIYTMRSWALRLLAFWALSLNNQSKFASPPAVPTSEK